MHTRYLGRLGPASITVNVQPGQQVPVFYRCPAAAGFKGAIGFEPQKTPGMWLTFVGFAVAITLIIILIISTSSPASYY